jgi:preprotein translocase subunit SecD
LRGVGGRGVGVGVLASPRQQSEHHAGLDIRGGLSVTLKARPTAGQTLNAGTWTKAQLIVNSRVNKLARLRRASSARAVTAARSDARHQEADEALKIVNTTGKLEVRRRVESAERYRSCDR